VADIAYPAALPSEGRFIDRLNTTWHEKAMYLYMGIVVLHWIEHISQAVQIWLIGMPRPESLGALGLAAPWLVRSEVMHFGFALLMIVGLVILRPGFLGTARVWWNISLGIQAWHFVEHSLLQTQAILGWNFFGAKVPTSIVQLWVPRPELHLVYNALVFIPMIIAAWMHSHPRPEVASRAQCTCAT